MLRFICGSLLLLGTGAAYVKPDLSSKRAVDLAKMTSILRESADTQERMAAARALGLSKSPHALAPLLDALKDQRIAVRWSAVEALGELGNAAAAPALRALLEKRDVYRWNRRLVVNALGSLRDRQAVPALLELLKDNDPFLRNITLFALKKIGDPKAFLPMVAMLSDRKFFVRRTAQQLLVEWTEGLRTGPPPRDQVGWKSWSEQTGFPSARPLGTTEAKR